MQEVGLDGICKVAGIAAQITIQRVEPWQTLLIGQNNPHTPKILGEVMEFFSNCWRKRWRSESSGIIE